MRKKLLETKYKKGKQIPKFQGLNKNSKWYNFQGFQKLVKFSISQSSFPNFQKKYTGQNFRLKNLQICIKFSKDCIEDIKSF